MTTINMHMKFEIETLKQTWLTLRKPCHLQSQETEKKQYGRQAAILKMTSLEINRILPIYISIVLLKFGVDIQSQTKVRVQKPKKSNMAARRPFWKLHLWKSTGYCLWPPSICIWNFKLKFQSKLDLCSGNHVVYRETDGRADGQGESSIPPSNFVGRGYNDG